MAKQEGQEPRDFPSHSFILMRSPVFTRMLSGNFQEGSTKRIEIPVAKIGHIEAFRDWLYTDQLDTPNWELDDMLELVVFGDKYELPRLVAAVFANVVEAAGRLRVLRVLSFMEQVSAKTSAVVVKPLLAAVALEIVSKQAKYGQNVLLLLAHFRAMDQASVVDSADVEKHPLSLVTGDERCFHNEIGTRFKDNGIVDERSIGLAKMIIAITRSGVVQKRFL